MVNTRSVNIALLFCISLLKYLKTTCWQIIDGCWCKNGRKKINTPQRLLILNLLKWRKARASNIYVQCNFEMPVVRHLEWECTSLSNEKADLYGDSKLKQVILGAPSQTSFQPKKNFFVLFKLFCVGQKVVTTASRPTVWAVLSLMLLLLSLKHTYLVIFPVFPLCLQSMFTLSKSRLKKE